MARGNGRMTIFLDDEDRRQFLQLFHEVLEDFALDCWNYCLMPNHYHATLRPTLPNISAAVQQLNGRYGQWWNQRHTKVGHVFQGRFKAQIVQRDGYALSLSRYVALNPVRAGLVERPEEWPWSSYASTIGLCPSPPFLCVGATLAMFGDADRATLQKRFAEFVLADDEDAVTTERLRSSQRIIGDADFKTGIRGAPIAHTNETANQPQPVA
jgi:putative transposase